MCPDKLQSNWFEFFTKLCEFYFRAEMCVVSVCPSFFRLVGDVVEQDQEQTRGIGREREKKVVWFDPLTLFILSLFLFSIPSFLLPFRAQHCYIPIDTVLCGTRIPLDEFQPRLLSQASQLPILFYSTTWCFSRSFFPPHRILISRRFLSQ